MKRGAVALVLCGLTAPGCDNAEKVAAFYADLDARIAKAEAAAKEAEAKAKALDEKRAGAQKEIEKWEPPSDELIDALKKRGAAAEASDEGIAIVSPTLAPVLAVLAKGAPHVRPRGVVITETTNAQMVLYPAPRAKGAEDKKAEVETFKIPPDVTLSIKELAAVDKKLARLRAASKAAAELDGIAAGEKAHEAMLEELQKGATLRQLRPLLGAIADSPDARLAFGLDRTVNGQVTFKTEEQKEVFTRMGLELAGDGLEGLAVTGKAAEKIAPASGKKKRRRRRR
jgi:hypothetical protein